MAPGDFIDEIFKVAAGALGWTPDVIWNTPVPQIFLALEGKYDFVIKTNPFGGGKDKAKPLSEDEKAKRLAENKAKALKFDMMVKKIRTAKQGKDG